MDGFRTFQLTCTSHTMRLFFSEVRMERYAQRVSIQHLPLVSAAINRIENANVVERSVFVFNKYFTKLTVLHWVHICTVFFFTKPSSICWEQTKNICSLKCSQEEKRHWCARCFKFHFNQHSGQQWTRRAQWVEARSSRAPDSRVLVRISRPDQPSIRGWWNSSGIGEMMRYSDTGK